MPPALLEGPAAVAVIGAGDVMRSRMGWIMSPAAWRLAKRHARLGRMTSAAQRIFAEAMALPEDQRVALVEALSDSLELPASELSAQWQAEVQRRIAELESGEVEPVAWADVESRIRQTLDRR